MSELGTDRAAGWRGPPDRWVHGSYVHPARQLERGIQLCVAHGCDVDDDRHLGLTGRHVVIVVA